MSSRFVVFARALIFAVALSAFAFAQNQPSQPSSNSGQSNTGQSSSGQSGSQQSMPGMDMSHHDMSNMSDSSNMQDMQMGEKEGDAGSNAVQSMEGHMDMGPHMKMTALRPAKPGDAERAQQISDQARKAIEKYTDYHAALADGFQIFLPHIPQKMYHFTNYSYARESFWHFNVDHPSSLLYEKHGDDYKLIGVMYTAPRSFSEDQLDQRIPLSVAEWHQHVNFCRAPASMPFGERWKETLGPNARFGMKGSISTKEACDAAGGTFIPVVLNWMVHLYPFEKDQASIWSVDRQHAD